jgi:hypothetical protein
MKRNMSIVFSYLLAGFMLMLMGIVMDSFPVQAANDAPFPERAINSQRIMAGPILVVETIDLMPTKDNTLYEDETGSLSNGAGQYMFVGRTASTTDKKRRAILAFDVAGSIPADATITTATLALNLSKTNSGATTINLHVAASDWGEGSSQASGQEGGGGAATPGDVTWIHAFYDTVNWTNPGGDYDVGVSATAVVTGLGKYQWSTPQMAADVQDWLDNGGNYGWILIGDEASNFTTRRFDSRENTNPANRPVLTVTYERLVYLNYLPIVLKP